MSRLFVGNRARLNVSLENDEEGKDKRPAEAEEHADGLEADLTEVAEQSADVEAGDEQVAEAVEGAEALENMCVILATAMENGGLDQAGAALMNNQADYILGRLGFESEGVTVSMESFGGVTGRVRATEIAMESLSDKVKEIWEKIIAAIERAMKWVGDLFNKIFGSAENLIKRAKKLSEQAGQAHGKTAEEAKFENESLAKKLAVGKEVNGKTAAAAVGAILKASVSSESESKAMSDKFIGSLEKAASGELKEANTLFGEYCESLKGKSIVKNGVANPKEEGFEVGENVTVKRSDELPGRMAVISTFLPSKAGEEASKNFRTKAASTNTYFGSFSPKKDKESVSKDLKTLSIADIEAICEEVEVIGNTLKKAREQGSARYDWKKKALAASKKLAAREAKEGETADDKQYFAGFRTLAAKAPKLIDEPALSVAKYALVTGQALLAYVELSLRQYK